MAQSILIVKLSSLGDVIHTLPAARAIKAAHPTARLGWAVEQAHAEVLRGQPFLDDVFIWPRGRKHAWWKFIRALRGTRWDLAIDFQGLMRSALVTRLSGARRRVGFSPGRELAHWFYNERVPRGSLERHAVERSLDLAAAVGASVAGLRIPRTYLDQDAGGSEPARMAPGSRPTLEPRLPFVNPFTLYPSQEDQRAVDQWTHEQGWVPGRDRLVLLHPHCRKEANRWPAARFVELARGLLAEPRVRVALVGGPGARPLCDEISQPLGNVAWRADGRFSLLGSASLFQRASLLITGDTGPMHLAVATQTPVVALFGPASPLRTGPYASDAVVLREPLACAPCFARHCPLHHDPPLCMDRLTVARVLHAARTRLRETADADWLEKSA